jgi:hypothetical protein
MNDHIDKRRIAITPGNTRTAGPSRLSPGPLNDAGLRRILATVTRASVIESKFIAKYIFLPNVPSDPLTLAFGIRACSEGEMPEVPQA